MSRSGYTNDSDDTLEVGRWRAQVRSATRGKRGQAFLRELAAAMDAMPEKALIAGDLVDTYGDCCTMGVVCKARGLNVDDVDAHDPEEVGDLLGVAKQLAAEIAYENDEHARLETCEQRWVRMRAWVESQIVKEVS